MLGVMAVVGSSFNSTLWMSSSSLVFWRVIFNTTGALELSVAYKVLSWNLLTFK
jgi:hypothetical protein